MNKPRHRWKAGIEQRCINHGCRWMRRNRADVSGNATAVMEYRHSRAEPWQSMQRVPQCGGEE